MSGKSIWPTARDLTDQSSKPAKTSTISLMVAAGLAPSRLAAIGGQSARVAANIKKITYKNYFYVDI
jgi:hypothetical protein